MEREKTVLQRGQVRDSFTVNSPLSHSWETKAQNRIRPFMRADGLSSTRLHWPPPWWEPSFQNMNLEEHQIQQHMMPSDTTQEELLNCSNNSNNVILELHLWSKLSDKCQITPMKASTNNCQTNKGNHDCHIEDITALKTAVPERGKVLRWPYSLFGKF